MALPMLIRAEMVSGAGRRSSRCAVALPAAQHTRTPPHRRCPRRHAVSLSLCVVVPQTLASLAVVSRPPISVITRVATFQGPRRWSLCPPPAPAWVLRKLRRVPLAHARAAINRRWVDAVAQKHDDNFPISSPNAATSPIRAISHNSPARRAHLPSRMRCPSAPSSCRRSRCRHRLSRWLPSRPTPIALAPQRPGG
jgi:hypothetical protein